MREWHTPDEFSDACYVCLAGSVMAQSFNIPPEEEMVPACFKKGVPERLEAIDNFRAGLIDLAISDGWGKDYTKVSFENFEVIDYYYDPYQFKGEQAVSQSQAPCPRSEDGPGGGEAMKQFVVQSLDEWRDTPVWQDGRATSRRPAK